jgi:hypothetical protein
MARKTRKQKQRAASRRQPPAIPGGAGLGRATAGPVVLEEPAPEAEEAPAADETPTAATLPVLSEPVAPVAASRPAAPLPATGGRRRIERLRAPAAAPVPARTARVPSNAASMFAPLESDDAAIPFDRVPYVRADLRRVAIIAGLMVVLIVIAAIVVSHVVS